MPSEIQSQIQSLLKSKYPNLLPSTSFRTLSSAFRNRLLQSTIDDPSVMCPTTFMNLSTTTAHGLRLKGLIFQHRAGRWYIHCDSTNTHVSEDSIELAWKKAFEQFTTKTHCVGCDSIIRVGEPCPPCGIRELIATKECTICQDDKHNFYQLRCGHSFCKDCLKRTKPQKCPLCRAFFNINDGWVEKSCQCGHCDPDDEPIDDDE